MRRTTGEILRDHERTTGGGWTVTKTGGRVGKSAAAMVADAGGTTIASLMAEPDATFLANAHKDIPDLVGEVERLRGLLDSLVGAHEALLSELRGFVNAIGTHADVHRRKLLHEARCAARGEP